MQGLGSRRGHHRRKPCNSPKAEATPLQPPSLRRRRVMPRRMTAQWKLLLTRLRDWQRSSGCRSLSRSVPTAPIAAAAATTARGRSCGCRRAWRRLWVSWLPGSGRNPNDKAYPRLWLITRTTIAWVATRIWPPHMPSSRSGFCFHICQHRLPGSLPVTTAVRQWSEGSLTAPAGAAQLPAWTSGSCLLEYVPATVEALQAQVCTSTKLGLTVLTSACGRQCWGLFGTLVTLPRQGD